ncbi:MAG: metallophosphoesterase family protein [Bacteroidota bacterium]
MNARTFVIGDIHGAFAALQQVMGLIDLQPADQLIFLGDYVDGWPESAQVIDYLLQLENMHPCIFIRGNHDTWCEDWLSGKEADKTWLFHGGAATVQSYCDYNEEQKKEHLQFFNRMRGYYVDADNRLFIHAGFSSMHGPDKEPYPSNYSWDRTLWETARCIDPAMPRTSKLYPKRLLRFSEIFIGHTPTLYYDIDVPMQGGNVYNVDTGAAFHGKLTAMNIGNKEYWQSSVVAQQYPNHKGRHV